jgi:hypothetical protein
VELLDLPPCGTDLNPIENVWAETKRVMAENWPDPSPAFRIALWDVVLDAWGEVAHSESYASWEDADGDIDKNSWHKTISFYL